jgi:hypothetical protein
MTGSVKEVKKAAEIDVLAVVRKLIGPVDPVGETHTDDARYTNLKNLAELVSALVYDMDRVAMHRDRPEASMRRAGFLASAFMNILRNKARPQLEASDTIVRLTQQLTAARQRIAELEAALTNMGAALTDAQNNEARLEQREAELREALRKYGGHFDDCAGMAGALDPRCTCGFRAALAGKEQAARFVATEFGSIVDTASQYVWLTLDHPGRSEQRLAYARAIAAALNANPPKEMNDER